VEKKQWALGGTGGVGEKKNTMGVTVYEAERVDLNGIIKTTKQQ